MERIRTTAAGSHIGERVRVQGWLHNLRRLGGISFIILRDGWGTIQAVTEDEAALAPLRDANLAVETVLAIDGTVISNPQAPGGLEALASEGPFCAIFIDADKAGYPEYLDWALENVRMGGLVLAHNAFQRGRVLDPDQTEAAVEGVRAFNRRLAEDPQLFGTIIPIGDGIAAAVRVG